MGDELAQQPRQDDEDRPDALGSIVSWAVKASRVTTRIWMGVVRELPGGAAAERRYQAWERAIAAGMRQWLDDLDGGAGQATEPEQRKQPVPEESPGRPNLKEMMAELLQRSAMAGHQEVREYLYAGILRFITPDEARILAGLSDGSTYPLMHVVERGVMGAGPGRYVLRNSSSVGRAVGVALADEVPHYLTRLHVLGLIEIGPALDGVEDQYEVLQSDAQVRAALRSDRSTRVQRRSVRISELGAKFWQRCDPTTGDTLMEP